MKVLRTSSSPSSSPQVSSVPRPAWTPQATGATERTSAASVPTSENVAWVSGTKGTFGRTIDGGKTWAVGKPSRADRRNSTSATSSVRSETTAYLLGAKAPATPRAHLQDDRRRRQRGPCNSRTPNRRTFYDAMAFWDAPSTASPFFSDPVGGRFPVIVHRQTAARRGHHFPRRTGPEALPKGEGAFAGQRHLPDRPRQGRTCGSAPAGPRRRGCSIQPTRGRTWTARRHAAPRRPVESGGVFSIAFPNGTTKSA